MQFSKALYIWKVNKWKCSCNWVQKHLLYFRLRVLWMYWYEIKLWTISLKKKPIDTTITKSYYTTKIIYIFCKILGKNCIQGIKWDFPVWFHSIVCILVSIPMTKETDDWKDSISSLLHGYKNMNDVQHPIVVELHPVHFWN